MQRADYLDHSRSSDELEKLGLAWRGHANIGRGMSINVVPFLENEVPKLLPHFALIPRSEAELPRNVALTSYDPTRIEVRENVYLAAAQEHPKASFQLWHEFSHAVLHDCQPKSLLDGVQERILLTNSTDMSVEEQADALSMYITVPRHSAESIRNLSEIMYVCKVPYAVAERAVRTYGIRQKRKLHPHEIQHLLTREEEPY